MAYIQAANLENLEDILQMLDPVFEQFSCSERTKFEVCVSVEEVYTNIVSYAYNPDVGDVEIVCETDDSEQTMLKITFRDWGKPFDPLKKPDPDFDIPFDERPVGGLGIYMVKKYMDHVEYQYENGCNILTIEKKL